MPFHAGLLRFPLAPARPAKAHLKAIKHQHRQGRWRARWLFFGGRLWQSSLDLGFGFGPEPLHQGADRGGFHPIPELGRQFGRRFIRRGHGAEVSQFVFQRRTELLVGAQAPALPHRTAPMTVSGIFSAPHLQRDRTEGRAQMHCLLPPVVGFASALGGKLRRSG